MRVLIYKRTHTGDPANEGVFGNEDCMGRIRNYNYDAVIGIGGKSSWTGHEKIREKINWVGIGPKKVSSNVRGDLVVFDHFKLYEGTGQIIAENYPNLYNYMYGSRKRYDMKENLPIYVLKEVNEILDSIKDCPKSIEYESIDLNNQSNEETNYTAKCSKKGRKITLDINEKNNC